MKKLGKVELAKSFGVSLNTIKNWILNGAPHVKDGGKYLFDLNKVSAWHEKNFLDKVTTSPDYRKARAEREYWAAKRAKLDYERESGELIRKDLLEFNLQELFTIFRQRVMSLPQKYAPIFAQINDAGQISRILEDNLRDFLTELYSYNFASGANGSEAERGE